MRELLSTSQSEEDSSVLAILNNPQNSTSVTKFAGPSITSIIFQQGCQEEKEE